MKPMTKLRRRYDQEVYYFLMVDPTHLAYYIVSDSPTGIEDENLFCLAKDEFEICPPTFKVSAATTVRVFAEIEADSEEVARQKLENELNYGDRKPQQGDFDEWQGE